MAIAIPADHKHAYILTAWQSGRSIGENIRAQRQLLAILANDMASDRLDAVLCCDGAYKGDPEESVLVLTSSGAIGDLLNVARMFDQESILRISRSGDGVLHFSDGRPAEVLGEYQACDPGTCDAWTTVRATGETFTFT